MNHDICPICEMELTHDHHCSDYVFSSFSIELELLELTANIGLEPYDDYIEENTYSPRIQERNLTSFDTRKKPVPLFLRL